MNHSTITNNGCEREDIAAYLDGELTGEELTSFETHLKSCHVCAAELRTQRELLCTLDVAFNQSRGFELPRNFTRVVAAHAESNLSGMRKRSERRQALKICVVLALLSAALLGAAARGMVFEPTRSFLRVAEALLDVAWRTVYNGGAGLAVIVRVIGHAVVSAPHGLGLLFLLAFLLCISLLPLLIARYHRAQI